MQAIKKEKNCNVQLERRVSLDILSVKNIAKLSAREMLGVEVGNGDKDLQWSSSLTVCHGHFGLSETEEAKLEKYCFFWKWGSVYGIGYEEIWKKTYLKQSECISRGLWAWWTVDLKAQRVLVNQGLDLDLHLVSLVITGDVCQAEIKKWYFKRPREPT